MQIIIDLKLNEFLFQDIFVSFTDCGLKMTVMLESNTFVSNIHVV